MIMCFRLKKVKAKSYQTKYEKHNDSHFTNSVKRIQTNIELYGVENVFANECIKEKIRQTNLKKYGCENPLQNAGIKAEVMHTCIKKYGTNYSVIAPDVRNKITSTLSSHFGSNTFFGTDAFKQWSLSAYDFENPMQNHILKQQMVDHHHTQIQYENIWFDSEIELMTYLYLKDHNVKFEYRPAISFQYADKYGKQHSYHPDFIIDGIIIEIKGDQFFNENGEIQNPYDHSQDHIYEAKHHCMLENNVHIIRYSSLCMKIIRKYAMLYYHTCLKR